MPKTINFLIYSTPGMGKTTFSALTPDVLVLDTENSSSHITGLRRVAIKTFSEIEGYVPKAIEKGIKTVVIDTLDELVNNYAKMEVKRSYSQKNGNLTMEGWGVLREKFLGFCRRMRDAEINVCFTAHAENEDVPGEGKKWVMKLPSNYSKEVMAQMDAVGFLGWATDAEGNRIRRLYLQPSVEFDAKSRADLNLKTGEVVPILPDYLDKPTLGKVLEYYEKHQSDSQLNQPTTGDDKK